MSNLVRESKVIKDIKHSMWYVKIALEVVGIWTEDSYDVNRVT